VDSAPETQRQVGGEGPARLDRGKKLSIGFHIGKWEKNKRNRNFSSCLGGDRNCNSFIAISKFLSFFVDLIIFFNIVLLMAFIEE